MQVAELLDRAKDHTGSDALTAKALGVSATRLSEWRHGHRPTPAEVQDRLLLLAEATDEEIVAHISERAGIQRKKSTRPGQRAIGSALTAIGACALIGAAGADTSLLGDALALTSSMGPLYIMSTAAGIAIAWLRRQNRRDATRALAQQPPSDRSRVRAGARDRVAGMADQAAA